jgi:hypothetical protein
MGRILKHRNQRRTALKNKTPGMSRALLEQVVRQGLELAQHALPTHTIRALRLG